MASVGLQPQIRERLDTEVVRDSEGLTKRASLCEDKTERLYDQAGGLLSIRLTILI